MTTTKADQEMVSRVLLTWLLFTVSPHPSELTIAARRDNLDPIVLLRGVAYRIQDW